MILAYMLSLDRLTYSNQFYFATASSALLMTISIMDRKEAPKYIPIVPPISPTML